jgi:DNA-binding transcriptional LysR family regulator
VKESVLDRLDHIRIFQVVADHASFAEAARQLRITPVAASRAVAALEKELEVTLLRRTTRSVKLTKQGADYLARSRRALSELDDAARAIRGDDAQPRGQLVVTAPVLFGRMYVMPMVASLLSKHSELSVRMILADRVMRLTEEGIDVAVRIAHLPDSALRAVRLATVRQVWVASPAYLAKHGLPTALEDLANHNLIHFDTVTLNRGWRRGQKTIRVEPRLRTDNAEASIDAASQGLGIARLFSYHVTRHVAEGKLVEVLASHNREFVPVSLVYQSNRIQSAGIKAFLAAARAALPGLPEL